MLRSGNLDDIKSVQAFNFEFATPEELAAFTRPRKMNSQEPERYCRVSLPFSAKRETNRRGVGHIVELFH